LDYLVSRVEKKKKFTIGKKKNGKGSNKKKRTRVRVDRSNGMVMKIYLRPVSERKRGYEKAGGRRG